MPLPPVCKFRQASPFSPLKRILLVIPQILSLKESVLVRSEIWSRILESWKTANQKRPPEPTGFFQDFVNPACTATGYTTMFAFLVEQGRKNQSSKPELLMHRKLVRPANSVERCLQETNGPEQLCDFGFGKHWEMDRGGVPNALVG